MSMNNDEPELIGFDQGRDDQNVVWIITPLGVVAPCQCTMEQLTQHFKRKIFASFHVPVDLLEVIEPRKPQRWSRRRRQRLRLVVDNTRNVE